METIQGVSWGAMAARKKQERSGRFIEEKAGRFPAACRPMSLFLAEAGAGGRSLIARR